MRLKNTWEKLDEGEVQRILALMGKARVNPTLALLPGYLEVGVEKGIHEDYQKSSLFQIAAMVYVCMCVCVCLCVFVCMCVYVCMHV